MAADPLVDYIRYCRDEKCIRDQLAILTRGKREVPIEVDGLRFQVDVVANDEAFEVKYDAQPYDGIGQALIYAIMGYKAWLIHVLDKYSGLYSNYVKLFKKLNLPFCVKVIDKKLGISDEVCP
ncbi:hypothetical protein [Caldivirga sp. UBA161]|uniref:hypothetical protein n=1 Tax=Caldivirga sp. UBA161 TaxID=1915569 RepID=UPI0025C450B1|nr:hypothetical protein [Caldivirga sp. UBA161]